MSTIDEATRQHLQEIKSRINVRSYAMERFGVSIDKNDKAFCLFHSGEKQASLHFYSNGYFCFSCNASGDCISLFQHFNPDAGFLAAIDDCAEYVGMPPCPRRNWTQEDYEAYVQDRDEYYKIGQIFMEASRFFQENLERNEYARNDIQNRWGLTEEFCRLKRVGYAPKDKGSLMSHLRRAGFSDDEIFKSGLIKRIKKDNGESEISPCFRGRIMFPYWVGARIAYFIGRATPETPQLYGGRDEVTQEVIWRDPPKYKKLPVYRPDKDEGISSHVQNVLYGMDFLHDSRYREIVITEGIADAMKAEQHGIPVVSPVTVRLKRADFEKCIELFKTKDCIYIINDSEENHAGEQGAMDIAAMLEEAGCNVKIGIIPRPEGTEKIDLADLMREAEDPVKAVDEIKKTARHPLLHKVLLIDSDADGMERTEQILSHRAAWARVPIAQISEMCEIIQDHFGLKSRQRSSLEASIRRVAKDEEKRQRAEEERQRALDTQRRVQSMSLRDRIIFEMESDNGGGIASLQRIAEWIIGWLKGEGARFYNLKSEGVGIVYFRKKLLEEGSTDYLVMIDECTGLNRKLKLHQAILEYVRLAIIREGKEVQSLSWITTHNGVKYYNLSGEANDTLICLDPNKNDVQIVPNGNNEHGLLLRSPSRMHPFTYNPDVRIEDGMKLLKELIFDNLTCSMGNRYLILGWNCLAFDVDCIGTRPILQCNGSSSSGKTTAAKMLSVLLFGEERHEHGSTMAAIYDSSANSPCIYFDNKENTNTKNEETDFMIAAATRARRQKKGSTVVGDIVQQEPQSMVLSTGIEIFARKELIERTLFVTFDAANRKKGFSEERVLRAIKRHRNTILSAIIKIVHKVHRTLQDEERFDLIEEMIRSDYPDNAKERNMSAFVRMHTYLGEICKHIRESYSYYKITEDAAINKDVIFEHNPENAHNLVFGSWVFDQNVTHTDANVGSNSVLYFFNTLYTIWFNKGIPEDEKEWDERVRFLIQEYLNKYQVQFRQFKGISYILCDYPTLHHAFGQLSNNSVHYSMSDPGTLRIRIKDGMKVMFDGKWAVGLNARRNKSGRQHVFVKFESIDDLMTMQEKYPDISWLHEKKLIAV